jgi:hypothetical protein
MNGYLRFREKCKEWQQCHDGLIRLMTSFQSQLETVRHASMQSIDVTPKAETAANVAGEWGLNPPYDPHLLEDLLHPVKRTLRRWKRFSWT